MKRRSALSTLLAAALFGMAVLPTYAKAKNAHAVHKLRAASLPPEEAGITSTWHQDPALRQQLAAESHIEGFELRPPQGYLLGQYDENRRTDNVFQFVWSGTQRTDGSAPELSVHLTKLKPHVVSLQTMDQRLDSLIVTQKQQAPWLVYSRYEHGLVNNESFVRVYFKDGPGAPAGQPVNHGFIYKATSDDGLWLVTIFVRDVEPYADKTVPLMEASVLTFCKQ